MLKTALALMTAAAMVLTGTSYASQLGLGLDVSRGFPHPTIQLVQGGGGGGGGRGSSSGGAGGYDAPSGGGGIGTGPAGPSSGPGRGAGAGGEIQCRTGRDSWFGQWAAADLRVTSFLDVQSGGVI